MTAAAGGQHRTYRALLRLFPADYRERYSDQMVQLFGDQVRDQGKARSWFKAMGDIPGSALSEHLRRNRVVAHSMTLAPTPAARLLGLLGVVGGAFLLLGYINLDAWTPDLFNLRLLVFNLGAIAIAIGVHLRQAHAGRLLSLSGAVPVVIANAIYLVFTLFLVAKPGQLGGGDYQPVVLFFLSAAAMWLSDAWFGLVTFRLGVLNRLSALALFIGSTAAFLGMGNFGLAPRDSVLEKVILIGVALHGFAWVLLGLELALKRRPAPPAATA